MRNNLQGTGTILPELRKNLHILAAKFQGNQSSAFISINLQYNGKTCCGMALAWCKNADLFDVH